MEWYRYWHGMIYIHTHIYIYRGRYYTYRYLYTYTIKDIQYIIYIIYRIYIYIHTLYLHKVLRIYVAPQGVRPGRRPGWPRGSLHLGLSHLGFQGTQAPTQPCPGRKMAEHLGKRIHEMYTIWYIYIHIIYIYICMYLYIYMYREMLFIFQIVNKQ